MTIALFNTLPEETAKRELFTCCGSEKCASAMMKHFPFISEKQLVDLSSKIWYDECCETDWRESFMHHPKIGDVKSLTEKFAGKEQAGVAVATSETIEALAKANTDYENKNGFIFIVCATGKSATEMLALLNDRIQNTAEEELNIAMGEQQKISIIRFKKLLTDTDFSFLNVSQITTHVLDTSTGIPGKDISIRLQALRDNVWQTIAQGITNGDGRILDLLPQERNIKPDTYKMVFDTGKYYSEQKTKTFYPKVEIIFSTFDETHYHVPLLVNPFGYSTYRGS